MRDVAVIGVGHTKFGKSEKGNIELFAEAAIQAMEEAGVGKGDIEALFVGNCLGGMAEGVANIAPFLAWELNLGTIPATRFEGACASATVAFRDAYMWVASGAYDMVLAGGTERTLVMGTPFATRTFAMGSDRFESQTGLTFPGVFAMAAVLYSKVHGIPLDKLREKMAHVSIKNHKHGAINPKAQFYKKYGNLKVEDVLNSPMIAYPLTLLDCCPFSDGGTAAILCSADIARKFTDEPIYVLGTGQASGGPLGRQEDYTKFPARVASARMAFKQAGLSPKDIQVLEAHDCFTIAEIILLECCGFFDWGTAADATEEGQTDIGGVIPTNPSGGLLGKGHPVGATGVSQIYAIVEQLLGKAVKGNQVDPVPEIGMTDNLGGDGATLAHVILGRSRRKK
ncbi:MAG: 3-ketoacyl-CoA thiolase [Candidatus Alkanophagales archaeon]|nr:MAG: 3-ketoacyl-CoA thiolase [Candidatus Alkanophagales archaeon]